MRTFSQLIFFCLFLFACSDNSSTRIVSEASDSTLNSEAEDKLAFDSTLAVQLGANKYGLKKYTVCFFDKGKQNVFNQNEYNTIEQAHFSYMQELIKLKEVVLVGYFEETDVHLGMIVFNSLDTTHITSLLEKDPKVQKHIIVPKLQKWTSSAAIPELYDIHQRIQKESM